MKNKHPVTKAAVLKAIRSFCSWCCTGTRHTMLTCTDDLCFFHTLRLQPTSGALSLRERISNKCHECAVPDPDGCTYDGKLHELCPLFQCRAMIRRGINYLI